MIFYLNFCELESWLTLDPLGRLREETHIEIEVRPMISSLGNIVNDVKPGELDPLSEYKARRAVARAQAGRRELVRQCERLRINPKQAARKVDPTMLSLGLLWMNRSGSGWTEYCRKAFEKTFREDAEVESRLAVEALISSVGESCLGFEDFVVSERLALNDSSNNLLEQGLLSAPAFILEGEIFHGREHLPLISWILKGREGAPPV